MKMNDKIDITLKESAFASLRNVTNKARTIRSEAIAAKVIQQIRDVADHLENLRKQSG